jgi:hypothetical protein
MRARCIAYAVARGGAAQRRSVSARSEPPACTRRAPSDPRHLLTCMASTRDLNGACVRGTAGAPDVYLHYHIVDADGRTVAHQPQQYY